MSSRSEQQHLDQDDNQNNSANAQPNTNEHGDGTTNQSPEETSRQNENDPLPDDDNNDDDSATSIEEINELRQLFDRLEVDTNREKPRTWADVHSLNYMTKNTSPLTEKLLAFPTLINHPLDTIALAEELVPIAFITIATGEKHKLAYLHSLNYVLNGEETKCFALTGAKTRATALEFNPQQLFKISTAKVPTLDSFIDHMTNGSPLRESEEIKISNSIALPPQFARFIMMNINESSPLADSILEKLLKILFRIDQRNYQENHPDGNSPGNDDYYITKAHLLLIQHLYAYSTMKSARQLCFHISDHDYALKWVQYLDNRLASQLPIYEEIEEEEEGEETKSDEEPTETTQPPNGPQVSFESDHTQQPHSQRPRDQTNQPNHFTFTGAPSPTHQQSSSSQTPPHNTPNLNTRSNESALSSAIENMTNNHSRFTHQMERLVNATAAKFSDDGTKKIGAIIKEVVCNASTTDGENPSDDLTPFARDILSLPGDQPLIHINILFQKNKIRAKATPKFISAARKGNLTYDNGMPDGLSITQLPQSLVGTDFEDVDMGRLMNMEENGTITENDTLTMNKSVLQVARTMHFLQDKARAWKTFCSEYFGPNSYTAQEAEGWSTWIDEHFNELQEIKQSRDKYLPAKIEVAISEQFNRAFRSSMLGVPDESIFNSVLREGILTNTTYLDLPSTIKQILEQNSNKRKNESNNSSQPNKKAKGAANKITHDNQPREITLTQDQYRTKCIPYVKDNRDKIPQYDNNTDECLKFDFLGYCNGDCKRKNAHKRVNKGTRRYDNLVKLRNEILQYSPNTQDNNQDFGQGEEN